MEATPTANNKHPLDSKKRRYLRLMEVGLSCWLAILPSMILAEMYNLYAIMNTVPVLLYTIGALIFFIGYVGRKELKEQDDKSTE